METYLKNLSLLQRDSASSVLFTVQHHGPHYFRHLVLLSNLAWNSECGWGRGHAAFRSTQVGLTPLSYEHSDRSFSCFYTCPQDDKKSNLFASDSHLNGQLRCAYTVQNGSGYCYYNEVCTRISLSNLFLTCCVVRWQA
jgi:hypothetical protein